VKKQANFWGAKDFCPKIFWATFASKKRPCDFANVGHYSFKSNHVGHIFSHMCRDFAKVFTDFAQIYTDFHQIKTFMGCLNLRLLHHWIASSIHALASYQKTNSFCPLIFRQSFMKTNSYLFS